MRSGNVGAERSGSAVDYQWLPTGRNETVIETPEKAGVQASPVHGLAIDRNEDWLFLTGRWRGEARSEQALLRSSDQGKHWDEIVSGLPLLDYHEGYHYYHLFLLVTKRGRIIISCERSSGGGVVRDMPHRLQKPKGAKEYGKLICLREDPSGRPVYANPAFLRTNMKIYMVYSDDDGKTWETTDFLDVLPFPAPCVGGGGPMREAPNGDIILPLAGHLEEGITYGWILCSGYISSRDGGETWGKPVVVARGEDDRGQWYGEIAVLPRKDEPWVAMARMNPLFRTQQSGHGCLGGYRCLSYDQGQTWTLPEPISHTVAYPVLHELRDGGILFAGSHWSASYMSVSHDGGLNWPYHIQVPLSGGDHHFWIHPDSDTLVVAHKDITEQKVLLTWVAKQPTSRSIPVAAPEYPEHRWTMRDLKSIYVDEHLKPYSASARLRDGTIVVAGVTGESKQEVFAIASTDGGQTWSRPSPICQPNKLTSIYPACLTGINQETLIIICTEIDQPGQYNEPTILRTLISEDSGQNWKEISSLEEIEGISCLRPGSGIIKDGDGKLVLPLSGVDKDGLSVCGTVRCQGPSGEWRLFQTISRAGSSGDILDQPAVLALTDGRWLGVLRGNLAEYRKEYANTMTEIRGGIKTFRQPPLWQATSSDEGKTWTTAHTCSAHYPHLLSLPDGGLMMTNILGSTLRYQVSYDDSASWLFENYVISYTEWHFYGRTFNMSDLSVVALDDCTVLGTYFCDDEYEGGPRIVATWIRALPKDSPDVRERGL